MMLGVDVSDCNGEVDFELLRKKGIDFVYVQITAGKTLVNDTWVDNVVNAQAAGLRVGGYHFGYALTPDDAIAEAKHCYGEIEKSGLGLDLPVFYDIEDEEYKQKHGFDYSAENITEICKAFCNNLGLGTGVYLQRSWIGSKLKWQEIGHSIWNAEWISESHEELQAIMDSEYPKDELNQIVFKDTFGGYVWQAGIVTIDGKDFDIDYMYINKDE